MTTRQKLIAAAHEFGFARNLDKMSTKQLVSMFERAHLDEDTVFEILVDDPEVDGVGVDMEELNAMEYADLLLFFRENAVAPEMDFRPKRQYTRRRKEYMFGGESYQDALRRIFSERTTVPRDELREALATDNKNLSVAVSILRNPKKTKNPVPVFYNRETQEFYLKTV